MRGLVLGKFMPPHTGHQYLIDFARRFVCDLSIVVGTLANEPIPGALRYQWLQQLYPNNRVLHLQDENPQNPSEHEHFWTIWKNSLEKILPHLPDYVFASETYGMKLAEVLGAKFIPVDLQRHSIPISASRIRENPLQHWTYLPDCVRAHYAKRICIFGPESTGKTTLARQLATHYSTTLVPEYARTYLEQQGGEIQLTDLVQIARGQAAAEDALIKHCNRLLICDTDTLATEIWSQELYGSCDEVVKKIAKERSCDLYLLCDIDIPWVADSVRYRPDNRLEFYRQCEQALKTNRRSYITLSGNEDERFNAAIQAIDDRYL